MTLPTSKLVNKKFTPMVDLSLCNSLSLKYQNFVYVFIDNISHARSIKITYIFEVRKVVCKVNFWEISCLYSILSYKIATLQSRHKKMIFFLVNCILIIQQVIKPSVKCKTVLSLDHLTCHPFCILHSIFELKHSLNNSLLHRWHDNKARKYL